MMWMQSSSEKTAVTMTTMVGVGERVKVKSVEQCKE